MSSELSRDLKVRKQKSKGAARPTETARSVKQEEDSKSLNPELTSELSASI